MTTKEAAGAFSPQKRPVVAVDVDEVLAQFVPQLIAFHNSAYGTNLKEEDMTSYLFHESWGGTRAEADVKMMRFFESPFFKDGLPVVEGAAEVLRKHAERLELHVVTSRQHAQRELTLAWVEKHYPNIFADFHFGNHFAESGVVRSKPDLCRAIDAVMIIDDNTRYATQCAEAGIRTCLFGDYAWNRTCDALPTNVLRTVNWAEVDQELESIGTTSCSATSISSCCSARGFLEDGVQGVLRQGWEHRPHLNGEIAPKEEARHDDDPQAEQGSKTFAIHRASCSEIPTNKNAVRLTNEESGRGVVLEGAMKLTGAARDHQDPQASGLAAEDTVVCA